jgi:hypothetical protein
LIPDLLCVMRHRYCGPRLGSRLVIALLPAFCIQLGPRKVESLWGFALRE